MDMPDDDTIRPIDTRTLAYARPEVAVPGADAREILPIADDAAGIPTTLPIGTWELRWYELGLAKKIYASLNELKHSLKGESMSTDLKTTVAGLFTSICGLLAIFHIAVPDTVAQIGTVIGVAVLGFFANKIKLPTK